MWWRSCAATSLLLPVARTLHLQGTGSSRKEQYDAISCGVHDSGCPRDRTAGDCPDHEAPYGGKGPGAQPRDVDGLRRGGRATQRIFIVCPKQRHLGGGDSAEHTERDGHDRDDTDGNTQHTQHLAGLARAADRRYHQSYGTRQPEGAGYGDDRAADSGARSRQSGQRSGCERDNRSIDAGPRAANREAR